MYGPTETTVWSSCAQITDAASEITVGQPVSGTTIEIVDARGRAAGIGVRGEIVISGAGVATGYLDRPELTNERFQNLTLDGQSDRYYRTGDVGWWDAIGQLRIKGRSDRQIKLRGHRIEPGEIESCAQQIPGIQRALVTTHAASARDVRLILHVVARDPQSLDAADLRLRLREWLPEYMVPHQIVVIGAFPLLPNGKIDLRRLAQFAPLVGTGSPSLPPQSHDEVMLQALWEELLGTGKIGRDQDFFALGGDSMLAMRLVTRVRQELQRHCTLANVFQNPTIASLCSVLSEAAPVSSRTLVALQASGTGTPWYCICGLQLYRPLVAKLQLDAPVFATYVPMVDVPDVVALAHEYVMTIRAQQPHGPYQLLGFSLGGVLAYETAQLLQAEGESVQQLVILDSDVPGEITQSPFKAALRSLRSLLHFGRQPLPQVPDYLRAIREYHALPYYGAAIYVEATEAEHSDPGYRWGDLIPLLSVINVPSDHLEMMSERCVTDWAPELRTALAKSPVPLIGNRQ
jgi:thioesterase domain-containing protein/aryl carrier-like protein